MDEAIMEKLRKICYEKGYETPKICVVRGEEFDFFSLNGILYIDESISSYKFSMLLETIRNL